MPSSPRPSDDPSPSTPPVVESDDKDDETGLQLPLSASLVLTSLPKDAHTALQEANENEGVPAKGMISSLYPSTKSHCPTFLRLQAALS